MVAGLKVVSNPFVMEASASVVDKAMRLAGGARSSAQARSNRCTAACGIPHDATPRRI